MRIVSLSGLGSTGLARHCLALSVDLHTLDMNSKELLILGQMCIFGQQFVPAQSALVAYLALPQPPERKLALVLLTRALLGLNEPDGANLQIASLLRDYPYDAQIHFAIDQVIDAQEAAALRMPHALPEALENCGIQNKVTLPVLANGTGLEDKDMSASPSVLFTYAVRCAALQGSLGDPSTEETIQTLSSILQQPVWAGRAELAAMQASFARQQMVGTKTPQLALHGHVLLNGALAPRTISLAHGTVLLVAMSVWAPSSSGVLRDLAQKLPAAQIYAITSWGANTGRHDAPSESVHAALRAFEQSSPRHIPLLIVPQPVIDSFHIDCFPAALMVCDGTVLFNEPVSSPGTEQMLLRTFASRDR